MHQRYIYIMSDLSRNIPLASYQYTDNAEMAIIA